MAAVDSWNAGMNTPLQQEDPEIYELIQKEKYRQYSGLELIASEVCPPAALIRFDRGTIGDGGNENDEY